MIVLIEFELEFALNSLTLSVKEHYLALQLSSLVHRDVVLALHTFYCQYATFRHGPDLQDTCQTFPKEEY